MNTFAQILRGQGFEYGGNIWRKRSSRTAEIVLSRSHDGKRWHIHTDYSGRWFYFSQSETVNRDYRWFQAMGAFNPGVIV